MKLYILWMHEYILFYYTLNKYFICMYFFNLLFKQNIYYGLIQQTYLKWNTF